MPSGDPQGILAQLRISLMEHLEKKLSWYITKSENNQIDYAWIGVDDISNNGQWVYSSSGEAVTFTPPWASNNPSAQDEHDCVHLGDDRYCF